MRAAKCARAIRPTPVAGRLHRGTPFPPRAIRGFIMGTEGTVFEGRTLDDAVRKGLEALGLARAEVTIKVVAEGSGGFLGIGARPYRVLIMPRPGGAFFWPCF